MRITGLALALVMAVVSPSLAFAAEKGATKDQIAKGMALAPALVTAAGSDCQVDDARFVGEATDAKTKAKTSLFEVACKGSEGLLVQQVSGQEAPAVFTCLEAAGAAAAGNKGATQCVLPENTDPKAGLAPFVAKAGVNCTPEKIRAIGHSATNAFFEVACQEGPPGYILQISSPPRLDKPISADPCIMFDPSNSVHCELTDRAAQFGAVDKLLAASGKPCDIKDRGFIGLTSTKTAYYEVACKDGSGFVLQQAANGAFVKAIPCAEADAIAGGCKLTDARAAKTEQAGIYTGFARKAGFDCNVSSYAPLPVDIPGKEAVELVCSNRPDGAIGIFGATSATAGVIYDCAHAELAGFRCALSKESAAYPKLTADLRTLGKTSCTVSNARFVGLGADKHGYIEVACADGLPGFMVEYTTEPVAPKSTLVCASAAGIGGGCNLPGNKK